jgi:hypothetical protein
MGNNFSILQDEREEAEYESLVQAVEIAQGQQRISGNIETGLYGGMPHQHGSNELFGLADLAVMPGKLQPYICSSF